jgi:hypothetical protein
MEYFYHYTTMKRLKEIQKRGLRPSRSLIGDEMDETGLDHRPAIFGFSSPAPENWLRCNVRMPDNIWFDWPVLADLLSSIAGRPSNHTRLRNDLVLLKVRLQPGDEVYVSDFGIIWKARNDEIDEKVVKDYCNSVTKLQSDFDIASKKLPEILCFNDIPANRIEFVEKIPAKTSQEISAYVERKRANPKQVLPPQSTTHPGKLQQLMARFSNLM